MTLSVPLEAKCEPPKPAGANARVGLVSNHAYSVLDTGGGPDVAWAGGRSFMRLRNPWGDADASGLCEWTGPWSDGSREWERNPEIRKRLITDRGYDAADSADGAFWMELSDIQKYFVHPSWCWFSPFLHNVCLTGAWDRDTAGGNWSKRSWGKNPHYKLDVQYRGTFLFTVAASDDGRLPQYFNSTCISGAPCHKVCKTTISEFIFHP